MDRKQALRIILDNYDDGKTLFVSTDGLISREIYAMKQKNVFPMTGSMGLASAIGFGIALNTKKRVVIISGDGSYVMGLGTQALIEDYTLPNLIHIVLDNGCYETTGCQKCVKIPKGFKKVKIIKIKIGGEKPPRIQNLKQIAKNFKRDVNA